VQVAVTLTPATTKAEKKNKDTSGGATERIRRDISYPTVLRVGGPQAENSMFSIITLWLRAAPISTSVSQAPTC
jgi:hypothetical protein